MAQNIYSLSLNIGHGNTNRDNQTTVNNTTVNNTTVYEPDEDAKIMEWLSPLEPGNRHRSVRTGRFDGVGDWLLGATEFQEWRGCDGGADKAVLFCSGGPGVGKTYLSSLVIDSLCDQAREEDIAVTGLYYDYPAQEEQTTTNVLGAILKQLIGRVGISEDLRSEFQKGKGEFGGRGLRLAGLIRVLRIAIASVRRVFICIDALDECLPERLPGLLKSLTDIVRGFPTTRIFLTGRPYVNENIQKYFAKVVVMPIIPDRGDVRNFLERRLDEDPDPEAMSDDLRADIMEIILERISDRFLLVSLSISNILGETTIRQRKKKLEEMNRGNGLGDAYTATLQRLKAQAGSKSILGLKVLMWVLYSKRPLQVKELRHALGVEMGSTDLDPENLPALQTLLTSCLGLVTVEASSSTVRLAHLTLQEHLSNNSTLFHSPHSTIAEVCLTYLNFGQVRALSPNLRSAPSAMPLLEYASYYWGEHTRKGMKGNVKSLALRLLDRFDEHISAHLLLLRYNHDRISGPYFHESGGPTGFTGLHAVAFLGISEIVAAVLEMNEWDANAADCMGSTALIWATRGGQEEIVKVLLEQQDIDPNTASTQDGWTPLTLAAEKGHEGVVKILLGRQDTNPNTAGTIYGRTPLWLAAQRGYAEIVKTLLGREGVSPNAADPIYGRTPLLLAIEYGHERVVKILLEREDLSADQADPQCCLTPLSLAAECGHERIVEMLLERKDFRTTTPDNKNQTPLSLALSKGHGRDVRILFGAEKQAVKESMAKGLGEYLIPEGQEIGGGLKDMIINGRKGLQKMYGRTEEELDRSLKVPIKKGEEMVRKLVTEMGCGYEVAKELTALTLYDVAILIDDSSSMIYEEKGAKKETLAQYIDHITEIYSMANESGVLSMCFMNSFRSKQNWTGEAKDYLDCHPYGGPSRIGTALKERILDPLVIGNPNQSKPLLVLIATDGTVEGEEKDHMKKVIQDCVNECEGAGKGLDAVSFQFSRIGNDPRATQLLIDLDDDPDIREYIDVLPVEFGPEFEFDKWFVLPKILLGAILPDWDKQDERPYLAGGDFEDWNSESDWVD